jgi:hypothetical protein
MNPFQSLREIADEDGLDLIIIGGHAVNSYGYLRTTVDIVFMIPESQLSPWRQRLSERGYVHFHESSAFVQFHAPAGDFGYPIDIMITADETFRRVRERAVEKDFEGSVHLVPRVQEMIALK